MICCIVVFIIFNTVTRISYVCTIIMTDKSYLNKKFVDFNNKYIIRCMLTVFLICNN